MKNQKWLETEIWLKFPTKRTFSLTNFFKMLILFFEIFFFLDLFFSLFLNNFKQKILNWNKKKELKKSKIYFFLIIRSFEIILLICRKQKFFKTLIRFWNFSIVFVWFYFCTFWWHFMLKIGFHKYEPKICRNFRQNMKI